MTKSELRAHLPPEPDAVEPHLTVVFAGLAISPRPDRAGVSIRKIIQVYVSFTTIEISGQAHDPRPEFTYPARHPPRGESSGIMIPG
jgi:hypothetical protein